MIRSHGHEYHFARAQSGDIRRWRPIRAVLPARNNDTFYAHIDASAYCGDGSSGARGSRFDQSVRKSSRFNQSEPSSRHATTKTATTTHATRGDSSILEIILHSVELSKNASASSGDTDTSDNFRSCNPGVFNSGATYRLELQCYHLAGNRNERRNNNSHNNNNNNKGLSMSSNAKAVTLLWIPRRARLGHLYI